jgi:hypothetical protein
MHVNTLRTGVFRRERLPQAIRVCGWVVVGAMSDIPEVLVVLELLATKRSWWQFFRPIPPNRAREQSPGVQCAGHRCFQREKALARG